MTGPTGAPVLRITVLGATGGTGRELVRQALERGHVVTAIARNPDTISAPDSTRLLRVAGDVTKTDEIRAALHGSDIIISGLGVNSKGSHQVLTMGARAAVAAGAHQLLWLGAFGTGESARAAGAFTRGLLSLALKKELPDKVAADSAILAAGGTVFHVGPLTNGPLSEERRTVPLARAPRRFFPARISRATVAASMLDHAEAGAQPNGLLVALSR